MGKSSRKSIEQYFTAGSNKTCISDTFLKQLWFFLFIHVSRDCMIFFVLDSHSNLLLGLLCTLIVILF